jgi:hypothetical protein
MKRIKKLGIALKTEPSPISARDEASNFSVTPRLISGKSDVYNNLTGVSRQQSQKSLLKISMERNRGIPFNFDVIDKTSDPQMTERSTDLTVKFCVKKSDAIFPRSLAST